MKFNKTVYSQNTSQKTESTLAIYINLTNVHKKVLHFACDKTFSLTPRAIKFAIPKKNLKLRWLRETVALAASCFHQLNFHEIPHLVKLAVSKD